MKLLYFSAILWILASHTVNAQQTAAANTIRTDGYYYTIDEFSVFNFYVFLESGRCISFIITDSTNVTSIPERLIIFDTIITGIDRNSLLNEATVTYSFEDGKIIIKGSGAVHSDGHREVLYWEYYGQLTDGTLVLNSYQLKDNPVVPQNIVYHFRPYIELPQPGLATP